MAISKAALLDVIESTLKAHIEDQQRYDAEVKEWQRKRREKWDAEAVPRLRSLRDMLTTKLKAGQVVTDRDISNAIGPDPDGYNRNVSYVTWEPNSKPGYNQVKPVPHLNVSTLNQLKSALSVIDGETISTSTLSQWGFRNLGFLFKSATELTKEGN
ncbi:hypothetical protein [Mycobacteroides abscessus]|uniref:hypothetical protein n=1 Tax=Mycobacteroides abscessus TaxID=36809 RepID=UPI0009277D59|nr:hypothetical protein [Mycobacteroides abscessus]SIK65585.1 Uncharacterised protein [Mycobacteroides abscessus subsp. abscessus]